MWWLALLIILIVPTIIILSILLTPIKKTYAPAWTAATSPVEGDPQILYEILLPIKSIPEDITLADINNLVQVSSQEVILFLNQYGSVIYTSPSQTYLLFSTTFSQFKELTGSDLYIIDNGFIGTSNQEIRITFKGYPLSFINLNFWSNNGKKQLLEQWNKQFNLLNQPLGTVPEKIATGADQGKYLTQSLGSNQGGNIGLLAYDLPDKLALQTLATSLGYPVDKFINQTKLIYFNLVDGSLTILDPKYTNNEQTESSLDLQTIYSVTPDVTVYLFYPIDYAAYAYLEILPLWLSIQYNLSYLWTSSLGFYNWKISANDNTRKNQEYLLLSSLGINTFQSSGDFGNYSLALRNPPNNLTQPFDLLAPDTMRGFFDSIYTVKVGGFSTGLYPDQNIPYNKVFSMNYTSGDNNLENPYNGTFFASGAGFSRGYYNDPSWKWKNTLRYRQLYLNSVKTTIDPRGVITNDLPIEVDPNGDAVPDLINIGTTYLYVGSTPNKYHGTSVSTPFTASLFNIIATLRGSPIKMLNRELHLHPELMSRPIEGRNNLFNLYGYVSDSSLNWDPVQGLGVPDPVKLKNYFMS